MARLLKNTPILAAFELPDSNGPRHPLILAQTIRPTHRTHDVIDRTGILDAELSGIRGFLPPNRHLSIPSPDPV